MAVLALIWLFFLWVAACASLVGFNLLLTRLIERLVPPIGQFVEIDGQRLHFVDTGEKAGQTAPPLLFIHGWMGQLNHFAYALAERFPERRVVLVDRPGCGYSQPGDATIRANAAAIAAFIDRIGLQKPLVVGHSLGGTVGLALGLDHASKVLGLALIAPFTLFSGTSPSYEALARQNRLSRRIAAWTVAPFLTLARSSAASRIAFAPDEAPKNFWKNAGGLLVIRPTALHEAAREIPQQKRELEAMRPRYATLSLPIDILFGSGDRALNPKAQGEAFCALAPQTKLAIIEGGHGLPMTRPEKCESFIRAALARQ